ncbi:MAG TPA: hypothetical protein VLA02_13420 [Reyranella sp.]|nr:hypothetical protein [Reyranella sp.]
MMRPGVTFALWLAIAVLVLLNDLVGDTWIADRLSALAVEWYKVLVPLPYVILMSIIHARRTAGPKWFESALLAALLWPTTTVLAELFYGRLLFDIEPDEFLDRFAFWWGAPYPILVVGLFAAPLAAGYAFRRPAPGSSE